MHSTRAAGRFIGGEPAPSGRTERDTRGEANGEPEANVRIRFQRRRPRPARREALRTEGRSPTDCTRPHAPGWACSAAGPAGRGSLKRACALVKGCRPGAPLPGRMQSEEADAANDAMLDVEAADVGEGGAEIGLGRVGDAIAPARRRREGEVLPQTR